MVEELPNPVRIFSEARDLFFISVLEQLQVPLPLFSDVRDSQLPQLMFIVESSRVDQRRSGEEKIKPIIDEQSLLSFVPKYVILNELLSLLRSKEVDLKSLFKEIKESETYKLYKQISREARDWLNEIDSDTLDLTYVFVNEILYFTILPKLFEGNKVKELSEKLKESNPTLASIVDTFFDPYTYEALKNKSWLTDNNNQRLIPINNENLEKGEKPDSKPLTNGDLRGRTNTLYSFIVDFLEILKSGTYPENSFQAEENSEDSADGSSKEKKDTYVPELSEETKEALELLPHALVLDMLLYQPYPDKQRLKVVNYYLGEIQRLTNNIPEAYFDLASTLYLILSSHISLRSVPYKALEKSVREDSGKLWKKVLYPLLRGEESKQLMAKGTISSIWLQIVLSKSMLNRLTENPKEVEPYVHAFNHLEAEFWKKGQEYIREELSEPFHFWSSVVYYSIMEIKSKEVGERIYKNQNQLLDLVKIKKNWKSYGVTEKDLLSLIRRVIQTGLSVGFRLKPELEKNLKVWKKYAEKLPDGAEKEQEVELLKMYEEAVENIKEEEAPIRRRRGRR